MKRLGPAVVLACLLLVPCRRAAAEWSADIVDMEWSPTRFVAVDKKAQSFSLLSRQSPLRVLSAIPCATGQELGDKFKEGDLKTPEGVYFITRRKSAGLNYELYGDLAFPLNFPNPADVVRRKSGHGIWIHGRGHALIPYETQGCVALSTPDIHRMDAELAEGMPVVIADEVRLGGPEAAKLRDEAREVVDATKAWGKAWENRSDAFFDFHDPEKFSLTEGKPFSSFRSHKEGLFRSLPWIKVDLSEIRAIPGPDYWVTYFVQLYRSPTLVSQGLKRLYWQRGADGRFRIIGMEYEEMPVTLAANGKRGKRPSPDEVETDTRKPDSPSEEEVQVRQLVGAQHDAMERVAQKAFASLSLKSQPSPEDQAILEVAGTGATKPGVSPFATDALRQAPPVPQDIPAVPPAAPAPIPAKTPPVNAPAPAPEQKAPEAAPAPSISPAKAAEIAAAMEGWRAAWERGDITAYMGFYADGARQGNLRGKDAIKRQKEGVWRGTSPGRVGIEVVAAAPSGDGYAVVCAESYQAKGRRESKGYKNLLLVPSGNRLLIAQERWTRDRPADIPAVAAKVTPAAAPVAEKPTAPVQASAPATAQAEAPQIAPTPAPAKAERTAQVASLVESWRTAWEKGNVDAYAGFYAPDAVQGDRRGRASIRDDKVDLWKDKAPSRISLSDVKIRPRKDGFVVTCVQDYRSRDGGRDHGLKTLYLAPSGGGFAIVEEKWSRL
ncbi:L,D-transpeptidase Cds6 family protein [Solidesulfovibrio alcoholivorans]|uniref:L,D-transpeptidase Cds6 family protein n=1 Tax=Solidesulfovibrio alcoholivorans TaxID=81406 RepID=UPI000496551B|nr:L,D-transpeptidase family protein [Solidesulfovibrio alcoholivorans]